MTKLQVTWKGIQPLIMHSCKGVNPLHPLSKLMKKYTSNRKKTEDDYRMISDIEWLLGAYFNEDTGRDVEPLDAYLKKDMYLYIPGDNIEATLRTAGKQFKLGKHIEKYVSVPEEEIAFDCGNDKPIIELWQNYKYRDTRPMVVDKKRITRTRPRFDKWSIQFELYFDETGIDFDDIVKVTDFAGQYVGLCDSRPKYGKFAAIVNEVA